MTESTKGMTVEDAIEELRQLIAQARPMIAAGAEIKPKELALVQAYEKSEQILSLLKTNRMANKIELRVGKNGLTFAGYCNCGSPIFLWCNGCRKHPDRCICGTSKWAKTRSLEDMRQTLRAQGLSEDEIKKRVDERSNANQINVLIAKIHSAQGEEG